MLEMPLAPTTSPYLHALRAAAQPKPPKAAHVQGGRGSSTRREREREREREEQSSRDNDDDDFCFICGTQTTSGQAYCSDECRSQDEVAPSPMTSPAPSVLPPLVPSRGRGHKSDSSGTSPPSSLGVDEDEDEDEMERFYLPPPVGAGSYASASTRRPSSASKKPVPFNYQYNLQRDYSQTASAARSPVARPQTNGVLSPKLYPIPSSRTSPPPALGATPSSASTVREHGNGTTSPPLPPTEVLTYRRRYQPDSVNGSRQGNGMSMSPALIARRRSSNLPSPLMLPKNDASRPSTASSIPMSGSNRSISGTSTKSATAASRLPASISAAATSLSNLLKQSTRSPPSQAYVPASSLPSWSPRLGNKTSSTATLRAHTQATCARQGCPVAHKQQVESTMSTSGKTAHFHPLHRRVSEPLSPYVSPSVHSPSHEDPFELAFVVDSERSQRSVPNSAGLRRPSLSASVTSPPGSSLAQSTRPQDHSGFSSFLFSRYNPAPAVSSQSSSSSRPDTSESGYDAQDEEDRSRRNASGPAAAAQPPSLARRSSSRDGLYMKGKSEQNGGTTGNAGPSARTAYLKDRLASLSPAPTSASSSSSETGATSGSAAGAAKPTRYMFGRGNAFKSTLRHDSPEIESADLSSASEGEGDAAGEDDGAKRGRRSRQASAQPGRPKHNHSTSVGEGSQYIVTIRPSKEAHQSSQRAAPPAASRTDSALVTSSSSSSDNDDRGRSSTRKPSNANINPQAQAGRGPPAGPISQLQRVASGQSGRKPTSSGDSAEESGGRGRSRQRLPAGIQRSVSPARSTSRAGARDPRRVIP